MPSLKEDGHKYEKIPHYFIKLKADSMVDTSILLTSMLSGAWPFFLLIIVILFFKNPFMKGKLGEGIISFSNSAILDENIYTPVTNITLSLNDSSTTQIDHILISKYGIFVIETKNMKGLIFGGEHQQEWIQQNFKQKHKFQNPLHQNYRHTKTLEKILGLPSSTFISVIAFVGDCQFKTPMPSNVFRGVSYTRYIKSFTEEKLNLLQIQQALNKLHNKRLEQSFQTDQSHVSNLKERFNKPVDTDNCPKCGGSMVLRQNCNNNNSFYGCSNYPKCRHTALVA